MVIDSAILFSWWEAGEHVQGNNCLWSCLFVIILNVSKVLGYWNTTQELNNNFHLIRYGLSGYAASAQEFVASQVRGWYALVCPAPCDIDIAFWSLDRGRRRMKLGKWTHSGERVSLVLFCCISRAGFVDARLPRSSRLLLWYWERGARG
jgi:hypothetical protein